MTVVLVIAAALLFWHVSSTNGRQRERRVSGASFASTIDARWKVVSHRGSPGFESFALSSTGARLDADGIPPAGAIGITITEGSSSAVAQHAREAPAAGTLERRASGAGGQAEAAIALMSEIVRTPAGAQGIEVALPARYRTLAGASAAEEAYEYVYGKRGNVQLDVVASRAGKVYFIELDTQLTSLAQGEAAFVRLLRGWRWR